MTDERKTKAGSTERAHHVGVGGRQIGRVGDQRELAVEGRGRDSNSSVGFQRQTCGASYSSFPRRSV